MSNNLSGIELIAQERKEQIQKHGRSVLKDVATNSQTVEPFGLLPLRAAATKCLGSVAGIPWPSHWDKEICAKIDAKGEKEKLIIAGAFIAAEIDRLNSLTKENLHHH